MIALSRPSPPSLDQIESDLIEWLRAEIFDERAALGPETDLLAAGFDSMSLVQLLLHVEKLYNLWIPEGMITEDALKSVRTLAALIAGLLNKSE